MNRAAAITTAFALLASVSARARAQSAFPSSPPPLAPPKAFVPPAPRERRLANGFETSLVPFGTAPLTYIQLTIGAGRLSDPADRHGLAAVTGSYLREGTRSFDRRAINLAAARLGLIGGDVQISVGDAETIISGRVLADSAGGLLRIIASLVREPSFPAQALEDIKLSETRQAAARWAQSASRAVVVVDSMLFDDSSLRDATDSSIARITLDDIRQFWSQSFGPRNATLYVSGVFDLLAMNRAIDLSFGDWSGGRATARSFASVRPRDERSVPSIRLIDRPGATQARVVVAYPVADPSAADYFALNQLNMVMGSVQTSRIIGNVRESHGYSYNISSRLSARPGASKWMVAGDVVNASVGAALREILAEIERVRDTPLSAAELRGFQTFMAGILLSENSTPEGLVSTLAWERLYGVDRDYLARFVDRVYAVTPADIQAVAHRYLMPGHAAIVIVGDRKMVEDQIAGSGTILKP